MEGILRLNKSNCTNCHKCIRYCPVKAIRFTAGQAHVVENECILCGQCFLICPQNAKEVSEDVEKVRVMNMAETVYASVAPSFVAAFPGIGIDALEEALQHLGFKAAEETAIGATIVKTEYERILREEKPNVLISSCCTSIDLLIRKHYPDLLFALAPVATPAEAHCADIKRRHPDVKTVFIGPCIAKKQEAAESDVIDAALSFEELAEWFKTENITLTPKADSREGGKARIFPTTGGVINTMTKDPDYTYIAVDGVDKCPEVLEEIRQGKLQRCFVELSACYGSCIGGPLLGKFSNSPAQSIAQVSRYTKEADFPVEQPEKEEVVHHYRPVKRLLEKPDDAQIEEMLGRMGKTNPADRLNCGTCGYNTCYDKAIAIIQGKAELSMCLPYMMKKAEGFSDAVVQNSPNGILVLNDDLEVQKINPVACRLLQVRREKDVLGEGVIRLMDDKVFFKVRDTGRNRIDERVYLTEYDRYVDRTILYNGEAHLFICMMRDVTEEMQQQEKKIEMCMQAVEIANDVAKKQLKNVQNIASLLGETAADTLIAIERLKETISDD